MSEIFVFGSNLAGIHGAGSARYAWKRRGAEYGVGVGRTGAAYAIPTKDEGLRTLPLWKIAEHVKTFLEYAREHPDDAFLIVAIGCGLAGYTPEEIGPMFKGAPQNCILPMEFEGFV